MSTTPRRTTRSSASRGNSEEPTVATPSTRGRGKGRGRGRKVATPVGGRPAVSAQESKAYGSAGRPDAHTTSLDPEAAGIDVGTAMQEAVEQAHNYEQEVQKPLPGILEQALEEETVIQEPIRLERPKTPQPETQPEPEPEPEPEPQPKLNKTRPRRTQQPQRPQLPRLDTIEEELGVSIGDGLETGKLVDETDDEFSGNFGTEGRVGSLAQVEREREANRLLQENRQRKEDRRQRGERSRSIMAMLKTLCIRLLIGVLGAVVLYGVYLIVSEAYPEFSIPSFGPWPNLVNRSDMAANQAGSHMVANHALELEIKSLQSQVKRIESKLKNVNQREIKNLNSELGRVQSEIDRLHLEQLKFYVKPESSPTMVNYFSPGNGAIINPYLTSPGYEDLYTSTWNRIIGTLQRRTKRRSHPPQQALVPWSDVGNCFCGPQPDGRLQIGVLLGHRIFPQELVVEHVHRNATPDIGAAPRDIEIWGQIWDRSQLDDFRQHHQFNRVEQDSTDRDSELPYPEENAGKALYQTISELDETWVRLGIYRYDIYATQPVQSFRIATDLEHLSIPINSLVFRARNNWGSKTPNTCIYRLKLHGKLADDEPAIKSAV